MGFLTKLLWIGSALSVVFISQLFLHTPPIPQLKDQWWADGTPTVQDESIQPFKIEVSDEVNTKILVLLNAGCNKACLNFLGLS